MNMGYELILEILIVVLLGCIWWLYHTRNRKNDTPKTVVSSKPSDRLSPTPPLVTCTDDDENLRLARLYGTLDRKRNLCKSLIHMSAINDVKKKDLARQPIIGKLVSQNLIEEALILKSQISTPTIIKSINDTLAEKRSTSIS